MQKSYRFENSTGRRYMMLRKTFFIMLSVLAINSSIYAMHRSIAKYVIRRSIADGLGYVLDPFANKNISKKSYNFLAQEGPDKKQMHFYAQKAVVDGWSKVQEDLNCEVGQEL